jgi:hypothetical protein
MSKIKPWWWVIGAIVIALFVGGRLLGSSAAVGKNIQAAVTLADPNALPGLLTGDAPWPSNTADLSQRLSAIGFPALSMEGVALHIHQHIDIFIDGTQVTVPAGIGINEAPVFFSPIHVHDTTGVVHVESPVVATFTLGEFFDVWGVKFTQDCIGGYCTGGGKTLQVYSDGTFVAGDPRQLPLHAHQEIVVAFGTPGELPNPIPSSYAFAPGL